MVRVTARGGTIGAYVWDYAEKMELIRHFWDAAVELNPDAAKLDEGLRFPLCHSEALAELFNSAGLKRVEVKAIDIPTPSKVSKITGNHSWVARDRLPLTSRRSSQAREHA